MLSPRTLLALVVTSTLSTLALSNAEAGDIVSPTGIRAGSHFGVVPVFPYGHGYGYGHWGYGYGDVIRARGEAAVLFSEAGINNEIARSLAIDNAAKAVETRLKTRALGKSVRLDFYARKRAGRAEYLARKRTEALERAAAQQLLEPEVPADAELPAVPVALNRE